MKIASPPSPIPTTDASPAPAQRQDAAERVSKRHGPPTAAARSVIGPLAVTARRRRPGARLTPPSGPVARPARSPAAAAGPRRPPPGRAPAAPRTGPAAPRCAARGPHRGHARRGCHRPVYHTLRLAPDADVLVRRHHDHPRQVPGAEARGSPVSFRVPGSARDYLDITDSKGLHWGLDLGCVADQDGD